MRSKDDLADNFRDFKQKWKTYLPTIMKYTISCFILLRDYLLKKEIIPPTVLTSMFPQMILNLRQTILI